MGDWVEGIGLGRSAYGTHSLRRTKVALIYKRTGNLRAVPDATWDDFFEAAGVDLGDRQQLEVQQRDSL